MYKVSHHFVLRKLLQASVVSLALVSDQKYFSLNYVQQCLGNAKKNLRTPTICYCASTGSILVRQGYCFMQISEKRSYFVIEIVFVSEIH